MNRRQLALDVTVFVGILLMGLARLPEPFFGDQAQNMLMGQVIASAGSPYSDLWDLKHPGIFFFFASGGALFGFNEIGIHVFELLWMLALAVCVRIVAGQYLDERPAASLAPAITVGTYYALTTSYHLTQTEAIVGLPLLLSFVAASVAVRPTCRYRYAWLFASGFSAAVVLILKVPYAVVPGLFWLLAAIEWRRVSGGRTSSVLWMVPPVLVGVLLPLVATILYLAAKPGLPLVWWTFVVHPREAASHGGIVPQRLIDASLWFGRTFRVPLALASVGTWDRARRGWDLMTAGFVAWMVGGALVIWVQVISWWPYHYLSLLVPVGLLAVQGVDTLVRATRAAATPPLRRAGAVVALLVFATLYLRQVAPVTGLISTVFSARPLPFDEASMRAFNRVRYQEYADALATTAFLREPGSYPGPVFVFGDPAFYELAGRRPAIRLLTWGTSPPSGTWYQFMSELEHAAPAYILVTDRTLASIIEYNPTLQAEVSALPSRLEQRYRKYRTDAAGTWYLRRDLAVRPLAP